MYLERVQLLKTLYETRKRAIDCREAINRKEILSQEKKNEAKSEQGARSLIRIVVGNSAGRGVGRRTQNLSRKKHEKSLFCK